MQRRATSKPSDAELRQRLSALEYEVTQHEATEPPFQNRYWDNHEPGIYVDVVTGDPLFSSLSKFDSGTGWPSFSGPISSDFVVTRSDTSHGMMRIEVRSRRADSHLGHMFEDGPPPTGRRYCINSAALRFVPEAQLEAQGYGEYGTLFASRGAEHGRVPANDAAAATDSSGRTPDHEMRFSTNACTSAHDDEVAARCTATLETAILAGGCFWGMEQILRDIPGVLETEVGYTGGTTPDPTYESVSAGKTGHAEAVRIVFDPSKLSYADLLDQWFFRMHDPTTKNRQAHDVGSQYRSAIFVTTPGQLRIAEEAKRRAAESGRWRGPIVTEIVQAGKFTSAEAYHQDYLQKHPAGYSCHYLRD